MRIEKLELDGCCTLQRIKISSGTLKRLILHCCKELVEVENIRFTLWFAELRKSVYLANDQFRHFQVAVVLEGDAVFVVEELPITGLPKECEIEHLELRILPADVCQKAILSGLL